MTQKDTDKLSMGLQLAEEDPTFTAYRRAEWPDGYFRYGRASP